MAFYAYPPFCPVQLTYYYICHILYNKYKPYFEENEEIKD